MAAPLPPDDAIAALLPADVRGDLTTLRHPEAIDVWYGVVWSRLGRGDLAWGWWDGVNATGLLPWIAAERARVLRELGLHDEAEALDAEGLAGAQDVVDVVMLRLGLVADAVGRGDAGTALLRHEAVTALLASLPDGPRVARQRLRAAWVAVEVALIDGATPTGEGLPTWGDDGPNFGPDYEHGTDFHRAKGLLFGGIVHDDVRLLDAAADLAPPGLRWAVHLARDDRGIEGAAEAAHEDWQAVVPPHGYERQVAATPTGRRLAVAGGAERA